MKKILIMAVAAIAALSSCSSDNDPLMGETVKQALTFTATMENNATRATYNSTEKCAAWEVNDQISINGKTYKAEAAGLTTTFKAATEGQEAEGSTYKAYFACTYDGTTATLPSEVSETWADGKFNMPMYATSSTTDLEFKNLCGVLAITVKSSEIDAVKSIRVSSADKAVSGAFTVDANNAAVLTNASIAANTLTVNYTSAVTPADNGTVFYVAVPAQTYQELKVELSADGTNFTKSMTTKASTDITVARNIIYSFQFADNAAPASTTTGTAKATINGSQVDVNWVQLWADGPKFADRNVEGTMNFTDATKTGADYVWGANWCTPLKGDMDELLKAAKSADSEKVTCTYTEKNGVYGFKFTGRTAGYESNSVFFPTQTGDSNVGSAHYWSGTSSGDKCAVMYLIYDNGHWNSIWPAMPQYSTCLVRPVLKN